MIWLNCLYVEKRASDLEESPVPVIWQNCLYVVVYGYGQWTTVDSVPVIWQIACTCIKKASDLAELPVPVILQNCLYDVDSVPMIWQNSSGRIACSVRRSKLTLTWQQEYHSTSSWCWHLCLLYQC